MADLVGELVQPRMALGLVCSLGVLLRLLLSLHPYSGFGDGPKFGDYEAQRHWMEITLHTPMSTWYRPSADNDLSYWGLDYPPLTAYQSYLHGLLLHWFEPCSVALRTSRGYETPSSKMLMRWTVLTSDLIIFFPAVLFFIAAYYPGRTPKERVWVLVFVLLQPALILIDHGHFQYNCISLGLAAGAAAAVAARKDLIACVLYSLSFNHKQMSAYYAPAFLAHLLGRCLRRRRPVLEVALLGCTVLATVGLCWFPYLSQRAASEVLQRLAPLERGIYEDYVANFWCGTSLVVKWKQLFPRQTLASLSLAATIAAALPSMIQQIWAPSTKGFMLAMLNSSFAFYLFSYQVHEKSILLPLLPATLLALDHPGVAQWLVPLATFSMLPLVRRDGLLLPYLALLCLFHLVAFPVPGRGQEKEQLHNKSVRYVALSSAVCAALLHLAYLTIAPPSRYPFLFDALITCFCFAHFVPLALYTNWCQWSVPRDDEPATTSKQKIQ